LKVKPGIVCLVPERRLEVTTEGGLDVAGNWQALTETRKKMNDAGIDVSLFVTPEPEQIEASARVGRNLSSCTPGLSRNNSTRSGSATWNSSA